MMALALIVGGYLSLVWAFGWTGLAVAAVHAAIMVWGLPRR